MAFDDLTAILYKKDDLRLEQIKPREPGSGEVDSHIVTNSIKKFEVKCNHCIAGLNQDGLCGYLRVRRALLDPRRHRRLHCQGANDHRT